MKSGVVSLVVMVVAVASLFSIVGMLRIDQIIHHNLYSYGLQFNYSWATTYWNTAGFVFAMGWLNIIAATILQLYTLVFRRRELEQLVTEAEGQKGQRLKPIGTVERRVIEVSGGGLASWVVVFMAVTSLFSIVGMYRIDQVVHHDLYSYGLQYSDSWAVPYWNTVGFVFAMGGLSVISAITVHLYTLAFRRKEASGSVIGSYRKWLFAVVLIVILLFTFLYSSGTFLIGGNPQRPPPPAGFWGLDIEASPTSGGTLIPSGQQNIAVDSGITVEATPSGNYILDSWQLDGLYFGPGVSNPIFVNSQIEGTVHTLTAVFKLPEPTPGTNVAPNPSFEYGPEYWSGWVYNPKGGLVGTTAYYSNDAYDGTHCVGGNITEADPSGEGSVIWYTGIPRWDLRPGKVGTYSLRVATKGSETIGLIIHYFKLVNGSQIRISTETFYITQVSTTTWQMSDWITFTTPNDPNYYDFEVLFQIRLVGWFKIDQVQILGPS